jgi:hypothetical protein
MTEINIKNAFTILPIFLGLFIAGSILLTIEKFKVPTQRNNGRIIFGVTLCSIAIMFSLIVAGLAWTNP